ncbi:MAG TPA: oligosaccharide flippase family protein [Stellaceae bacterium]|nr:oligosaccharide flippase family protein [Stellaceae bacterium]
MPSTDEYPAPRSHPVPRLGQAVVSGYAWLLFLTVSGRGVQLLGQMVLAWLLTPADFGSIGLAYTVTTFVNAIINPGIDDVLVQRGRHLRHWTNAAFWLSLSLATIGAIAMIAAAPVSAQLYREERVSGLIMVLALAAPISALSLVPLAILRASLKFRLLAGISLAELTALQGLSVLFAYLGFGAYSFVVPVPLTMAGRALATWLCAAPRIRFDPQLRRWRYLIGDGAAVFIRRVVTTVVAQGDYVALGLLASPPVVGIYYFAYSLAVLPLRAFVSNLANVMFPALVLLARDPTRQAEVALKSSRIVGSLFVPLCFLQAAICRPGLDLIFGSKWNAAVPLFQILSVGFAFDAVGWLAAALLQARGEFWRNAWYGCLTAAVFLPLVAIGGWRWSALGVATAVALYHTITVPIYFYAVLRRHGVSWREVAALYLVPATLASLSVGAALALSRVIRGASYHDLDEIALVTIVSVVLYFLMSYPFSKSMWQEVWLRTRVLGWRR